MTAVSFKVSRGHANVIQRIATRAAEMRRKMGLPHDRLEIEMDVTATHANGCPLQLARLLLADDVDFAHDVFGIARHLDRETGQLRDCFLPRYSVPEGR